jgi:hypothetical protein
MWGIFAHDGVLEYERTQLLILEPMRIKRAFRYVQFLQTSGMRQLWALELNERIERFQCWRAEFEKYYGARIIG